MFLPTTVRLTSNCCNTPKPSAAAQWTHSAVGTQNMMSHKELRVVDEEKETCCFCQLMKSKFK